MRTYDDARALAGTKLSASNTNGRAKYIRFELSEDGWVFVFLILMGTRIVSFLPGYVTVQTGGYVTPTTFDGIAAALGIQRIDCGTRDRVPYLLGHRMSEGMRLDYAGRVLSAGRDTPLAKPRKRRSA